MALLTFETTSSPGLLIVSLNGALDSSNAKELSDAIDKALTDQTLVNIAWDVAGLEVMASAGLRVVMTGIKTSKARGGKFYLVKANKNIAGLMKIVGMTNFYTPAESIDECRPH